MGGVQGTMELKAKTFMERNKGLVYADVINKGFVAVKATKVSNHDDVISSLICITLVLLMRSSSCFKGKTCSGIYTF